MKLLFYTYLLTVLLIIVLPLNGFTNTTLHNTYVVTIRLDYFLHSIMLLPWLFLTVAAWDKRILPLILLGVLFAAFTESLQFFLPYRSFNINDMLANMLGVVLGMGLLVPRVYFGLMRMMKLKVKS